MLRAVPQARGELNVIKLGTLIAGGPAAVPTDRGVAGGEVLPGGQVPSAELTGSAGFQSRDSLDAAGRASLAAAIAEPQTPVPPPPVSPTAPNADVPPPGTDVVPAHVPEMASDAVAVAARRAGEAAAERQTAQGVAVPGAQAPTPVEVAAPTEDGAAAPAGSMSGKGEAVSAGKAPGPVVDLIMPEPPTELGPAAAARGGTVAAGARSSARAARELPPAEASVADARGAVTEPAAETAARAQEELAAELGSLPAPSPEIVALCERIRTAIRSNRPEDEDELLESDPTREAKDAGATVTGSVEAQAAQVTGPYDAMAQAPAGTPALKPTPVDAPSPAVLATGVDARAAAPDPIPPEQTSLDADVAATDQRIAESGIDTRVTREIPDGPFAEARAARGELGEAAQRTPQEIQAEQQQAIETAQADMAQLQLRAIAAMHASRTGTIDTVGSGQGTMVTSEEQTRGVVAARAQRIYDDAQRQVDALLEPLTRTAIARWEAGLNRLSQDFHDSLDRVKRWIDERHSGVGGQLLAVGDYITGLPDWVTDEYNRAEQQFGDGVCDLLLEISTDVNGVVAAAQALIRQARDDIDATFQAMEDEFPEWAAAERARFSGMLDGLSQRVTAAQTGFVDDVTQRAIQAVNEVHAETQARREEAGGLVGRVFAAIDEFIDDPVRAIINGLLRLAGIPPGDFWALVARIEQVASDIADDPVQFVNNLVAGLKLGFQQFFDHFGTHVLRGFWAWLFSELETPIAMPRDYSPRSLLTFALQVMGVTWPRIREILVRHVGPTAVEVVEAAWQLISVLIERGPEGLVELVEEQLKPESVVGMILDAAVEYLMETLIQQVVVRVIGMLNPVGAIAQAIELIYQICAWVFRNAARIFRFVEAVVNGMADVIAGNLSGLASAVERALATLIPPVIDFLAGLLHLEGLPEEVAGVIERLQTVVYAAMDRVIGFLAERAKALLARLGLGSEEAEGGSDDSELGTSVRFTAAGEGHRTWIERSGGDATLMVASEQMSIRKKIGQWRNQLPFQDDDKRTEEAAGTLDRLEGMLTAMDADADALAREFEEANRDPTNDKQLPSDDSLEARQSALASLLQEAFKLFEEKGPDELLRDIEAHIQGHGSAFAELAESQWRSVLTGPRRAPDGTTPIWDMSVVSTEGALAWLSRPATHQQLLPWFLVGGQQAPRSASSDAFMGYAFESNSPDPAHTVRPEFLRVLGSDTVAQMKIAAARNITPEDNNALLERIRTMSYTASGGPWGTFVGIPDNVIHAFVKTAIVRASGIIPFLRALVSPGNSNGVTLKDFSTVWNDSPPAKDYAKSRFRGRNVHEWIPTDFIPRVLEVAASAASAGNIRDGLRWITAQNTLRSPTRWVLHHPSVLPHDIDAEGGPTFKVVLSGHVGSFREKKGGKWVPAGFIDMQDFHNWLRNEFNAHHGLGPLGYIRHLQAQLPARVWDGRVDKIPASLLSHPVGMHYRIDDKNYRSLTIGELAALQRANWDEIQKNFVAAYDATEEEGRS
ncbi:hypothetical protein [Kocuria rosea]|uniref:Uncharacterized protein n=1 Tax=Kocuria rosea subsp. polaris TaxID=136273 RepID=A0A0A6VSC5_KOCRO|nr:hypothetical protein [Kocuria polaris]KHD96659.1 hypothetical protein GY22_14490 [Kocuria polaris]